MTATAKRATPKPVATREITVSRTFAAPRALVFTFAWEEEGERGIENVVTITFTAQGRKTLMNFRQAPFQSAEERDGHQGGWGSAFDRLDDLFASQEGETS